MVEESGQFISNKHPQIKKVGVLATSGTVASKIYSSILAKYDIEVVYPTEEIQSVFVHPAIYDPGYGIKAFSNPIKKIAKTNLETAAIYLSRKGVQAVILGCTEIPLAITSAKIENSLIIDATSVLASALIRESKKGI